MLLTLITPPAETPVSLAEVKTHLRIEHGAEDTYLSSLIAVALAELDGRFGYLRRAIVTQTWDYLLPWFPVRRDIRLPFGPLQSVTHIKYYDRDNAEQTFDAAYYEVVTQDLCGYVYLKPGESWPETYEREAAVTIRTVSGFGLAAAVPQPIKQAMLLRIGELYDNRGDSGGDGGKAVNQGGTLLSGASVAIDRLLQPYRVVHL